MTSLSGIRYGDQISAAAQAHGLDPKLLAAVAAQETGGPGSDSGNNIVGDGGHGHGLFQIDDRSWAFASTPAAMDPAANANAAAGILSDDLKRYGGDVHAALSAYNSGSPTAQGTTTTWNDGSTLGYADSVMRHYAALGGDPAQLAADTRAGTGEASLGSLASRAAFLAGSTFEPGTSGAVPATAGTASQAGVAADVFGTTGTGTGTSTSTTAASSLYGMLTPPTIQTTTQSPFAAPVSWASETSANGPAGGKEAADADSLVADSIDASDDALDDRNDS